MQQHMRALYEMHRHTIYIYIYIYVYIVKRENTAEAPKTFHFNSSSTASKSCQPLQYQFDFVSRRCWNERVLKVFENPSAWHPTGAYSLRAPYGFT